MLAAGSDAMEVDECVTNVNETEKQVDDNREGKETIVFESESQPGSGSAEVEGESKSTIGKDDTEAETTSAEADGATEEAVINAESVPNEGTDMKMERGSSDVVKSGVADVEMEDQEER